ncbi:proline--tRNA ligase [Pelotomaculum terephthalicicum JT]|uniref:proline--tRNA ligase n=1 Tax=Pelotomaculum TaxID=191373 RepID=UPI0009C9AB9D|nr:MULTISPECIES: proline--tRNA ligase [Pelotomaculum]MCG9967770.1 proline--tRNA ligase [Pelotomaculum terephthalicicum JT]OPX85388.1 MAG: Proline--tRNA ligase [Pelotomaculum sp. PtaB.Bin117]
MRTTELFAPTLREVPAEAEVVSHQLLLRAGFIRREAAGVYTYLPLALRVLKKINQIIREEMDRQGGQELQMPIIQSAELWQESGRWDVYGPELFRLKDRHDRDFALGPTHEEIITALVRGEVSSYKQLPLLLYQIQNKYRDERRPRFGLLRGREFIMKDLYSFDRDEHGLQVSYQKMHDAYTQVFRRCGLRFRPVEADSGAIGGSDTHEFMVLADSGEATILFCEKEACGYAANVEKAAQPNVTAKPCEDLKQLAEVPTPGAHTVEEVADFLHVPPQKIIKTLLYETEKEVVAVLVRGDRDVNEIKLSNALHCLHLKLAGAATVQNITGARVGFAGPVNLKSVRIIADLEISALTNAVTGANKDDAHLINVNPVRDFNVDIVSDIRMVQAGEPCPRCGSTLKEAKGIEVGQIFKLGDKYSKVLGATYLDESGLKKAIIMGCYGIGVTRTMAAAIEQNHDQDGIIWPVAIAPFHAVVVPVSVKDEKQTAMAEETYDRLVKAGIETVIDDRPERAGVKFKDADLIGYPLRITVGAKAVANEQVEVRVRKTGEVVMIPVNKVESSVIKLLGQL